MSSKVDGATMNCGEKQELVPNLRFPQFRDDVSWLSTPIANVYSFKTTNTFSRDQLNYSYGSVKNIHYGDIHSIYSTLFDVEKEHVPFINPEDTPGKINPDCYCVEGDIVFADASEDLVDIGKSIEIVNANHELIVCGLHTILARKTTDLLGLGFGGYLFKSAIVRSQIQRESQGTKVLGLSAKKLAAININFPEDKSEQLKITNCLSSLDELITGQSQKLDALKTYKNGLMQQLFPAEGETMPKLRFPEFRNTGEWKKQKVSNLLRKVSNRVDVDLDEMYQQIGIRSHGKGIFHKEPVSGKELGDKRVFWVDEDAFVVNIVFAWEQAVANTSIAEKGMIASHRFPMYRAKDNRADVTYVKYFFLTNKGKYLLGVASPGGAGRNKTLGQKEFENLEFVLPQYVEEQKKIAECLSFIDDRIATQTQKLDMLKVHRRGLMQQLFPALDEALK